MREFFPILGFAAFIVLCVLIVATIYRRLINFFAYWFWYAIWVMSALLGIIFFVHFALMEMPASEIARQMMWNMNGMPGLVVLVSGLVGGLIGAIAFRRRRI